MILITDTDVFGFESAIRGMRNPMNSWEKSDSGECIGNCQECPYLDDEPIKYVECMHVGYDDLVLSRKLIKAGSDHRKFLRMIHVQADVNAPLYWWKEYDTYKVGTVANSCSTMHKIHAKEFTLDDFSHEHLIDDLLKDIYWLTGFSSIVLALNKARKLYLETKDKKYWYQMIQFLPSSYNQLRTIDLNYETLLNIYHARKNHKLDEWHTFCEWIEKLPYMRDFLGLEDGNAND